jgi:hypothetical protein
VVSSSGYCVWFMFRLFCCSVDFGLGGLESGLLSYMMPLIMFAEVYGCCVGHFRDKAARDEKNLSHATR